jgi:hypothetical protein
MVLARDSFEPAQATQSGERDGPTRRDDRGEVRDYCRVVTRKSAPITLSGLRSDSSINYHRERVLVRRLVSPFAYGWRSSSAVHVAGCWDRTDGSTVHEPGNRANDRTNHIQLRGTYLDPKKSCWRTAPVSPHAPDRGARHNFTTKTAANTWIWGHLRVSSTLARPLRCGCPRSGFVRCRTEQPSDCLEPDSGPRALQCGQWSFTKRRLVRSAPLVGRKTRARDDVPARLIQGDTVWTRCS